MLWNQLNKETREHHVACVELFYRLHCLAPSANICEDIICHALLDPDKVSPSVYTVPAARAKAGVSHLSGAQPDHRPAAPVLPCRTFCMQPSPRKAH